MAVPNPSGLYHVVFVFSKYLVGPLGLVGFLPGERWGGGKEVVVCC